MLPSSLQKANVPLPVLSVLEQLGKQGHEAYLVGGCVRDLLRGVAPKDFDVATNALPQQVIQAFRKVIPTGLQHGTVTVVLGKTLVEVTTYRSEAGYEDGRRPTNVVFEKNIEADLSRRDFTMNAMAFDPIRGHLCDPFDGQKDLQARVLRCVGEAADRFAEDGLRALRAVRFATVLELTLDPATQRAIPLTLHVFAKISRERIRDELMKTLAAAHPSVGVFLLENTGLMGVISADLRTSASLPSRLDALPEDAELRLASWLEDSDDDAARARILESLRLPRKTIERLRLLLRHPLLQELGTQSEGAVRRWMAQLLPQNVHSAAVLARARAPSNRRDETEAAIARVEKIRDANPPLTTKALALDGRAIMEILGTGPSPDVGRAAQFLLEHVLDDPSCNTAGALEQRLRDGFRVSKG